MSSTAANMQIPERPVGWEYEDWILVRRTAGWGNVYLPEFRKVIKEGDLWYIPREEAEGRPDFEAVEGLVADSTKPFLTLNETKSE